MTERPPAIVGTVATGQGELPGKSANEIAVDAIGLAVADAGLRKEDIDGLITFRNLHTREGIDEQIGRLLGISPRFSATLDFSLVH